MRATARVALGSSSDGVHAPPNPSGRKAGSTSSTAARVKLCGGINESAGNPPNPSDGEKALEPSACSLIASNAGGGEEASIRRAPSAWDVVSREPACASLAFFIECNDAVSPSCHSDARGADSNEAL